MKENTENDASEANVDDNDKIRISSLWETLKRYDTYIGSVNFKSGLLASFNVAVLGGIIIKLDALSISINTYRWIALASTITIILSTCASLLWIIKSIWPNISSASSDKSQPKSMIFFGSVAQHFSSDTYRASMSNRTATEIEADLCIQIHEVATITQIKFALISKAAKFSKLTLVALMILGLAFTLNHFGVVLCQG